MLTRMQCSNEIEKITKNQKPVATGLKLPIGRKIEHDVYEIPIEFIKPNPQNDRIASKIREYEATQGKPLSVDSEDDVNFIYSMIFDEHPNPNKKTMEDLAKNGQQEIGVITHDGIIIDGNRRATLIKKLYEGEAKNYNSPTENFRYFKAVVLDDMFSRDEIRVLETELQLGKDEKVPYDPINVYIKIDNLLKSGKNTSQIAGYMNRKEKEIKKDIEVFNMMKDYLEYHNKEEHFTMLQNLQDQFIKTQSVLSVMENLSYDAEWEYKQQDVIEFKGICFDVLRSKPEGKKYRDDLVGGPSKRDGIFARKLAWESFKNNHKEIMSNSTIHNDSDWKTLTDKFMGNLKRVRKEFSEDFDGLEIKDRIISLYQKAKLLEGMVDSQQLIESNLIEILRKTEKIFRNIREQFDK